MLECLYTPLVETKTPLAEELLQMRSLFLRDFEAAFESTKLADRPDYERANAFLVKARQAAMDR